MDIRCSFVLSLPLSVLTCEGVGAPAFSGLGRLGISEGCITLLQPDQFATLRQRLVAGGESVVIPGSALKAYGTIEVTAL